MHQTSKKKQMPQNQIRIRKPEKGISRVLSLIGLYAVCSFIFNESVGNHQFINV